MKELKKSVCGSFQKMLGLSTATELYGTKHEIPHFIVNMGDKCYTNNKAIVLGLEHPCYQWCQDKNDLFENSDYVKGHEIQHIKSTTEKAWQFALHRGAEVVIENICKEKGIHLRFSCDNDYNVALQKLREKGIYLNMNAVRDIVHFITNSIEDGRIEWIRANDNAVFKKQMVHIRLLNWKADEVCIKKEVKDMTANEKLTVILNQILTLATCSVYEKGFAKTYFGTSIQDELDEIIPFISKGIISKRCRYMAENAIKICDKLSLLIAEAATVDAEFTKVIEWIRASIKDLDLFNPSTKEDDEEENSNGGNNPFGQSDLYLILPDDEYDELMKNQKEGSGEGDGPKIHVKREHPKEEEKTGEEKTKGASSDGKNEEDKPSQNNHQNNTGNEGSSVGDGALSSTGSGSRSESSAETSKGKNQSSCQEASGQNEGNSGDDAESVEKMIEEQMKEAAKEASGMAKDSAETAENILKKQEQAQNMKEDVKEPLKKTDESVVSAINGMYDRDYKLIEEERKYEVDEMLPPELMQEVQTLSKKLESYMHDKKKKFRKFINSGKLDSSRTAMLAANNIDVFKEEKISKGVKACAELIVDNSGSMGYGKGSKREYACKALAKIEMVFAKYFPIKIFAFDASGGCIVHEIIKGWNEKFSRSAAYNFLIKGRYGNSNFDGYSIRVATADILSRPEKKKLLIVLSDGLPCYGGLDDVKKAVTEARLKGVSVVGIYFSDDEDDDASEAFKEMYQKDYIVTTPDKIEGELVQILKKFFC